MQESDETPVAWRAMPYQAPVLATDGTVIGSAESLLGDEEEDIFHGIVVKQASGSRLLEIDAAQIEKITEQRIYTKVSSDQVGLLPDYREEHWFGIEWGGLFRKHPKWGEKSHF